MMGKTHLAAGIAVGFCIGTLHSDATTPIYWGVVGMSALGSLIPDVDHPNSLISQRLLLPFHWLLKHRGPTHGALVPTMLSLVSFWHSGADWAIYLAAFAMGYWSHLLLDALTIRGIPLLWPVRRPFRLARLRANGWGDSVVVLVSLAVYGFVLIGEAESLGYEMNVSFFAHEFLARLADGMWP